MKKFYEYIYETYQEFFECEIINEENKRIFPQDNNNGKLVILAGDHCEERQNERKVSNKEIIDAIFAGYNDIKKLYSDGKVKVSKDGEDNYVTIIDARKSKENPVCVCVFVKYNRHPNKLQHPTFIVKTVFKKTKENPTTFSGLMRYGRNKPEKGENFVYIY